MMTIDAHPELKRSALALCLMVTALSWIWVLSGSGTGMNPWAMTTLAFPPGQELMLKNGEWTPQYVIAMLVMWWAMMLAMMVPGMLVQVMRTPLDWPFSIRFAAEYALVWFGFSMLAVAFQYGLEQAKLLHGMRMWSVNSGLSRALLGIAALSQIWRIFAPHTLPDCAPGRTRRSGFDYGTTCVITTGTMMLLLFVGGLMNLYWMVALAFWAGYQKIWATSLVLPVITSMFCLGLMFKA